MIALIEKTFSSVKHRWRMVGLLYICNVTAALLLAAGFYSAFRHGFGDSMLSLELLSGFDAAVVGDFMRMNEHLLAPLTGQLWWFVGAYMVLMTILGAGVVGSFANESAAFSLQVFLETCARYLGRMMRLFLLTAGVLALGGIVAIFGARTIFEAVSSSGTSEAASITGFLLGVLLVLVFLFLALLVMDYTRVAIVAGDERSVVRTFGDATKFVFTNFFSTVGWQLLMLMMVVALAAVYLLLAAPFKMATGAGIVIVFVFQQASVVSRMWARVMTVAGQVDLFQFRQDRTPLPAILVSPPEKSHPIPAEVAAPVAVGPRKRVRRKTTTPRRKRTR
ncbi:MAG TPA: hypothetical protein VGA55_02500 [Bacteroidota bacterium]